MATTTKKEEEKKISLAEEARKAQENDELYEFERLYGRKIDDLKVAITNQIMDCAKSGQEQTIWPILDMTHLEYTVIRKWLGNEGFRVKEIKPYTSKELDYIVAAIEIIWGNENKASQATYRQPTWQIDDIALLSAKTSVDNTYHPGVYSVSVGTGNAYERITCTAASCVSDTMAGTISLADTATTYACEATDFVEGVTTLASL